MNTWLEIQHSQSSTEAGTATPITTSSTAAKGSTRQHTRRAGGGVARNKRTPRTKSGGSIAGGILDTFGPRFNRFQSVNYTALQQGDLEAGASGSSKNSSNYLSGSEHGSSSEEDIFPTRSSDTPPPRRKARRKMGRRPGYSMRDAFEEGRAVSQRHTSYVFCIFLHI
ncbi:uncharacterized protein LOC128860575 [Anastrepha ludens]|uniref:uncharacterized protein LOC128860575 n=1 Tax=Anastrepha ludens TaxID=28586 RepID=UPI0023B0FBD7|nr:uncharacterized protein LOC128860575 [Anastrepha ludens]XP_053954148.1 uncharacterized protein LOC128860575 [Anastrepha ludens]